MKKHQNHKLGPGSQPNSSGSLNRRQVLKGMSAWAAAAGALMACKRKPPRHIVSRVQPPEYQKPGQALYYSTTWLDSTAWGGVPYGAVVKVIDGRPVKIDGNPNHPLNLGASSAQMQASLPGLYDPDRLTVPVYKGSTITWSQANTKVIEALSQAKRALIITNPSLGPSAQALLGDLKKLCPHLRHQVYDPLFNPGRQKVLNSLYNMHGRYHYRLHHTSILLSLDCDFLGVDGDGLQAAAQLARARSLNNHSPLRHYAAEGGFSLTGTQADIRIPLGPSGIGAFASALLKALQGNQKDLHSFCSASTVPLSTALQLVKDLQTNHQRSLVIAGSHLPGQVHALTSLLNKELEAMGYTMMWDQNPHTLTPNSLEEIKHSLSESPEVVIFMGVNPVYHWPGSGFNRLLAKCALVVGHGLYMDETLSTCTLALPSHHYLESWNDASPVNDVYSLCQPVIQPLHNTRQQESSLLSWAKGLEALKGAGISNATIQAPSWHKYLMAHWHTHILPATAPAISWVEALKIGVTGTPGYVCAPVINEGTAQGLAGPTSTVGQGLELVVAPHHAVGTGSLANNAWLQEWPHPVTKLTWDSVALISPVTAKELGFKQADEIKITAGNQSFTMPVLLQQGVAPGLIHTTMGHGRWAGGSLCKNKGYRCPPLLPSGSGKRSNVKAVKTGVTYALARTQTEFSLHDRPLILSASQKDFIQNPKIIQKHRHRPHKAPLYPGHDFTGGYKWVMAIDQHKCTGCGACQLSCMMENNIPVVGKAEVLRGRAMHWLRLDSYLTGPEHSPRLEHQPMLCQHCDSAPCESVCPVAATAHSQEGLNEMAYNRCVGTRYCANNCPFKARKFNYFNYQKRLLKKPVQELIFNPQVTVRTIGVMEKCTFCLQRINEAKFKAKNKGQRLLDGEVLPACAQVCPSGAIAFGNANDPDSRVSKWLRSGRAYTLLDELNIGPNVTYLGKIWNDPFMGSSKGGHS